VYVLLVSLFAVVCGISVSIGCCRVCPFKILFFVSSPTNFSMISSATTTLLRAVAVRLVTAFSPTSTIDGFPWASRWVNEDILALFFLVKIQTVVKFKIILIFSKTISAGLLLKKPQGRFKETLPIKPYYILNGILRLLIYELFNLKFSKTIFP
jgi:hypothetical protein